MFGPLYGIGAYFVMNPIDVIDAIDAAASGGASNPLSPSQLYRVDKLVLRTLPADCVMFRPASMSQLILVRADVADRLRAAGLSGLSFREPESFKG